MDLASISPIIKEIALFGGLTENQLDIVTEMLEMVSYNRGDLIFKHGGEPSHIYIIKSGQVKILCEKEGEEPFEIVVFGVGDCFGETSVIGILPHSGSAVAIEDADLIVLSRKALMALYDRDSRLFSILILNIAREACRRLYRTDQLLLQYAQNGKK